jgi:hypothetical protein
MKEWMTTAITIVVWFAVVLTLAILVAMFGMGTCSPDYPDCNVWPRRLAVLVLAVGLIGIGVYAYRRR